MSGFLRLESSGRHALADEGPLQSGLCQLDLSVGGILLLQDALGTVEMTDKIIAEL